MLFNQSLVFDKYFVSKKIYLFQTVEGRQVDEAVASIFHTVLFHRSLGKFCYKEHDSYSVGTVGYEDVDCDFIDFTYVSYVYIICI